MAKIQITNDRLEGRGDAMDFLREIAQEIGRGYSKGPGWEYLEGDLAPEEEEDEETTATNDDVPGDPKDKDGKPLEVGDSVTVIATGEEGFIFGEEDGKISLHSDTIDFTDRTFSGSELVKSEPKDEEDEDGTEPWKRYRFAKDWSDRKEGDIITAAEIGDGAILKDLLASGTIEAEK